MFTFIFCYVSYMQIAFKHRKRKLKKNPPPVNENYKPFVSILIPAHNEEKVIQKTVESVRELDYPNFEIIVIDDRSTDSTADVIKILEKKYENVKAICRKNGAFPGKSAVLNDALVLAKGEAILVFDADARMNKDFLSRLVKNLEPKDVGAVQARKVISNRDYNFLTRCQDNEMALDTHFQNGRDAVKGAVELRGNGELIKRKALEDIGGWNNYTITDDLDMSTRLHIKGWDVRFCSDVCVYEEGITSVIPLLKQRRRWIEGSIRRYLENFVKVLFSKDMSLRTSLDMTAYICEFLLPFLTVSEICFQIIRYFQGKPTTVLISLCMFAALSVFFWIGFLYALSRYNKLDFEDALTQATETGFYLIVLWTPVVIFIIFKMILTPKSMDWGKTEHGIGEMPKREKIGA